MKCFYSQTAASIVDLTGRIEVEELHIEFRGRIRNPCRGTDIHLFYLNFLKTFIEKKRLFICLIILNVSNGCNGILIVLKIV